MSIERAYGKIAFSCDECGDESPSFPSEDFDILRDRARKLGWRTVKEKGEWHHYCPDCARR